MVLKRKASKPVHCACLVLLSLIYSGCVAMNAPNTNISNASSDPVAQEPPVEQAPVAPIEPSVEEDNVTLDPAPEISVPKDEVIADVAEEVAPIDPQQVLESALETTQAATEMWRNGNQEEALASLDEAYELMLQLPDDSEDLLQGKENLRLMISKRVVEIYASRRTTAGSLERAIPLVMNEHVAREIKSFQTREKKFFLQSYARSGRFRPMILEALRREGLPEQLSWLPLIESGFKTGALSRARALGLWQFIPSTGYRYGLNRNQWVDERMDPEKATQAAIEYLRDLHDMFGDWMSALAGYNCGEARVMRAIKSQHINYLDDFWDLYQKLPRETARYVPRFLATLIILEDPDKYGIELPPLQPSDHYTTVEINRSVKLADLDALAGLPTKSFQKINPELRYKVTPNKPYKLKVPEELADKVSTGIASLDQWELPADSYVVHRVRRGETLSTIARKYRSSVRRIMSANNLRNQHRIKQGQRLKIPGRGTASPRKGNSSSVASNSESGKAQYHTVKRGESLWVLARKYKTSVDRIKTLNDMTNNHLSLGQRLTIRKGTAVASNSSRTYKVRRGDTLAKIAKRHKVRLSELLRANNLTKRDKIYPKQTLVLP